MVYNSSTDFSGFNQTSDRPGRVGTAGRDQFNGPGLVRNHVTPSRLPMASGLARRK
jgi:hypothetical protein